MKHRSVIYLIVALALLLAPVATSAAPFPFKLGHSCQSSQPAAGGAGQAV